MLEIISRDEAKEKGLTHYFTGVPCFRNHLTVRYVSTHQCYECHKLKRTKYVRVVKDKHARAIAKENNELTYKSDKPCKNNHDSLRYTCNGMCLACLDAIVSTDTYKSKTKASRERNKDKKAAYDKLFDARNKEYRDRLKADNRAKRLHRRVKWEQELTEFVLEEAFNLTKLRREATGIDWHMDHVIPLCGDKVSGLHVWNNFAVIPAKTNLQKNNKYEVV
jgi:hypothetical protein